MSRLVVRAFTISLDGYGAGPDQSLEQPLGAGAEQLHSWLVGTQTFNRMVMGGEGGSSGTDDKFAAQSFENIGAWIMGRNMFTPSRGAWPEDQWRGWWGENPPYHSPVFVLSHHAREPLEMEGGNIFHFVTGGIGEALERARKAAGDQDIRLLGGASTIRQYLEAGEVDELHIALSPVFLDQGEPLFGDLEMADMGYRVTRIVPGEKATHYIIGRDNEEK